MIIANWGFLANTIDNMSICKPLRESCYKLVIAILIMILLALICFCLMYEGRNSWLSGYGDILSGVAAAFSGILLYATLVSQNRSFKQERFEITFYNLLNQRTKALESVWFKCEDLEGVLFKQKVYQGELAFAKVWRDIGYMIKSLSKSKFIGMMDDQYMFGKLESNLAAFDETEQTEEAVENSYCKRVNYRYGLSLKNYEEMKVNITEKVRYKSCYELLVAHKTFVAERYFRFLDVILSLLEEVKEEKYCKILLAQMSKEELQILNCQALVDEVFHKRLVDAGIDKLLENEFEIINK